MKAYIYRIGKGTGNGMEDVSFSQELHADSLGEAVNMVKAMTRKRLVKEGEETVQILDEEQSKDEAIWTHSAEDIRNG